MNGIRCGRVIYKKDYCWQHVPKPPKPIYINNFEKIKGYKIRNGTSTIYTR